MTPTSLKAADANASAPSNDRSDETAATRRRRQRGADFAATLRGLGAKPDRATANRGGAGADTAAGATSAGTAAAANGSGVAAGRRARGDAAGAEGDAGVMGPAGSTGASASNPAAAADSTAGAATVMGSAMAAGAAETAGWNRHTRDLATTRGSGPARAAAAADRTADDPTMTPGSRPSAGARTTDSATIAGMAPDDGGDPRAAQATGAAGSTGGTGSAGATGSAGGTGSAAAMRRGRLGAGPPDDAVEGGAARDGAEALIAASTRAAPMTPVESSRAALAPKAGTGADAGAGGAIAAVGPGVGPTAAGIDAASVEAGAAGRGAARRDQRALAGDLARDNGLVGDSGRPGRSATRGADAEGPAGRPDGRGLSATAAATAAAPATAAAGQRTGIDGAEGRRPASLRGGELADRAGAGRDDGGRSLRGGAGPGPVDLAGAAALARSDTGGGAGSGASADDDDGAPPNRRDATAPRRGAAALASAGQRLASAANAAAAGGTTASGSASAASADASQADRGQNAGGSAAASSTIALAAGDGSALRATVERDRAAEAIGRGHPADFAAAMPTALTPLPLGVAVPAGVPSLVVPTSLTDPAFAEALGQQVGRLVDGDIPIADLVVTPPELGPVRIELTMRGDSADVVFTAAAPETLRAIEASGDVLRTMLAERGVSLGSMDVGQGQPQSAGTTDRDQASHRQHGTGPTTTAIGAGDGVGSTAHTPAAAVHRQGLVDLFA